MSYAELAAAFPRSGGENKTFFRRSIIRPSDSWVGLSPVAVGIFGAPSPCLRWPLGKYAAAALPGDFGRLGFGLGLRLGGAPFGAGPFLHRAGERQFPGGDHLVEGRTDRGLASPLGVCGVAGALGCHPACRGFRRALSGPFAVSLMFVLYAYSGWNAAAYIIGEVRQPQRTVPASLLLATVVVTILYVFLNAVFLASGPMSGFAGKIEVAKSLPGTSLASRGAHHVSVDRWRLDLLGERHDLGGSPRGAGRRRGFSCSWNPGADLRRRRSSPGYRSSNSSGALHGGHFNI